MSSSKQALAHSASSAEAAPGSTPGAARGARGRGAPDGAGSWRSRLYRWDMKASPYAFVAPFFLLFGAFSLVPLLYTAWYSLHNVQLSAPRPQDLGGSRQLREPAVLGLLLERP